MKEYCITLPTLHADQAACYNEVVPKSNRRAVRCGRRWGKSKLGITIVADTAIKGHPAGWFAPLYKYLPEIYDEIYHILKPLISHSSKNEGIIRLKTGGRIDFWTLENEEAGRSRFYKNVVIDEGAFTKNIVMKDIWEKSIEPTLIDLSGNAWVMSNTNGVDPDNFFYQICHNPEMGFAQYHAPTWNNPTIPLRKPGETDEEYAERRAAVFKKLREDKPPLVFAQEHEAAFINWSGVAFFSTEQLLNDGQPVPYPTTCDAVFAVMDTATKTGKKHDGSGIVYFAYQKFPKPRLFVIDYELRQIEGALLETLMPNVFSQCETYAKQFGARRGSLGVLMEDKASGMVLLQHAVRKDWPMHAIDSKLTSLGKDERAISASPYVYQHKVKFCPMAFEKVVVYKGRSANHLLNQIVNYQVGVDQGEDDLLDCFCYGVSLTLGGATGF